MERKRVVKAYIQNLNIATWEELKASEQLMQLLVNETPKSIEYAHRNKKIFATIFEVNDSSSYVEIHKRDWIHALEKCVSHYVNTENYESCAKIQDLISAIKSGNSKFTINNKLEQEDE